MKLLSGKINYKELVKDIWNDSKEFASDIGENPKFANMNLWEFYNYVLNLPYKTDGDENEILSRPKYTLNPEWNFARDCDDKALAIASYLRFKNKEMRIIVSGRQYDPHHIYIEFKSPLGWIKLDPTYPKINKFGKPLFPEKFREVYTFD